MVADRRGFGDTRLKGHFGVSDPMVTLAFPHAHNTPTKTFHLHTHTHTYIHTHSNTHNPADTKSN